MSPAELSEERRRELQAELDENRRWELRLPGYAVIALVVLAAIVVVRTVFVS